jgi:hypothetical protein
MTSPWRPLILWLAGALALIALGPAPAVAHESQPGLLELRQLTADPSQQTWEVIWRAPIYYGQPHPARLVLPADWDAVAEPTVQRLPSSELHRQLVRITPDRLDGSVSWNRGGGADPDLAHRGAGGLAARRPDPHCPASRRQLDRGGGMLMLGWLLRGAS